MQAYEFFGPLNTLEPALCEGMKLKLRFCNAAGGARRMAGGRAAAGEEEDDFEPTPEEGEEPGRRGKHGLLCIVRGGRVAVIQSGPHLTRFPLPP